VGVWIEMSVYAGSLPAMYVTPRVGVWIEMRSSRPAPSLSQSHPAWVCGLKSGYLDYSCDREPSHPAWVCGLKSQGRPQGHYRRESHTTWVCGLKYRCGHSLRRQHRSHPAWVCGLKYKGTVDRVPELRVTPRVGVWIEMTRTREKTTRDPRHTPRGCVD